MPDYNFKNNLKSTLQAKLWNDATSVSCNHVVVSEDADTRRNAWPAFPFTLTIVDTANDHIEIIKCTSLANNSSDAIVFHCDRAQESTTAQTFEIATTNVEHRLTAAALNAITSNIDEVTTNVSESLAQHLGSIISVLATDTYVPIGCVPCNGTEYTRAQFPTLYDSYLTGTTPKLLTCTYTEWSTQVSLTGNCAKFALDTTSQKFKVPLLKDGDSITQASSASELGKSYKAGLPNITGKLGNQYNSNTGYVVAADSALYSANFTGAGTNTAASNNLNGLMLDASRCNTIYGNSSTVTDEQVRLRHFVVLASAQNNASMFDWSNYMAGLAGKANNDLSNLTPAAKMSLLGILVMTGSITLNGTTDNTVVMTDIVPELNLEVGDVIRIDTGSYSKLHTVESITDNSSIIVNYEHAGNRRDGSLKLPNFTGQATVTRIAKWFNAPIGLGQAWVNVAASRTGAVNYSGLVNRPMQIMLTGSGNREVSVAAAGSAEVVLGRLGSDRNNTVSPVIPAGSTYKLSAGSALDWVELR